MKGLPLAYNRDMQEDKEGFLDADRTVKTSLRIMTGLLEELVFRPERMREACKLASSTPRSWPTIWWAKACPSAKPTTLRGRLWPPLKRRAKAWKT